MGTCPKRTNRPTANELRERSDKAFAAQQTYNTQLVEAWKAGKLKSPRLITEAQALCPQPTK